MAGFSERYGYSVAKAIQFESMDMALRNSIWNLLDHSFFQSEESFLFQDARLENLAMRLFDGFYKKSTRLLPDQIESFIAAEESWVSLAKWYLVYDYCEYWLGEIAADKTAANELGRNLNFVLEREKAGYRAINGLITPIIEAEQIAGIEAAIAAQPRFAAASEHIKSALKLYADRQQPDYRNSVKESISAVESVAKILSGKDKATLSDALKIIDAKHPMHQAFKDALSKLYAYTGDEKGIRHALLNEDNVDDADARFMIVACSAFVTYLISRS